MDLTLGRKHGLQFAEQFHHIARPADEIDAYVKQNATPLR